MRGIERLDVGILSKLTSLKHGRADLQETAECPTLGLTRCAT